MTDVLVITGPVNAAQLDQPDLSPGTKTVYVGSGGGTGSSDMYTATITWLRGMPLRERVMLDYPDLRRLGVIWFSAGHGSVQAMLRSGTDPSDVQAWMCLDGLYTSWKHVAPWAKTLATAAMNANTTLLASASTSTPGQYADSKSAWTEVMDELRVPPTRGARETAVELGLPEPDDAYQHGAMLVCGYDDINHHQQVPAMREGFGRWWNDVRAAQFVDVAQKASGTGWISYALAAIVGAGAILAGSRILKK